MVDNPEERRRAMGMATLQGGPPQGFFSPYRHAAAVPEAVEIYSEIGAMMAAAMPRMDALLEAISGFREAYLGFDGEPPAPRFQQDWFPGLDAAAAYAMVRHVAPARIVEVGSGHSTRFMARAIADGALATEFVAIDPRPRATLKGLPVLWIESLLSMDHVPLIDALGAGDILFVDSSHILWPGSDVDTLFARLLPRLNTGVIVHIHDVFLPDGYPETWRWRGYTEQQGVAALLAGGGFEIMFSSHYAITRGEAFAKAPILAELPMQPGAYETSLWLRKSSPNVWRP